MSTEGDLDYMFFSPIFELTCSHVRVGTFTQTTLDQLIQQLVNKRFVLCVNIFHSLQQQYDALYQVYLLLETKDSKLRS